MSQASDFRDAARKATSYEVIGQSGKTYLIFWFEDGSVCAAEKRPTDNKASATYHFGETKTCLRDCGLGDLDVNTYQYGRVLRERLEA